MCRREAIDRAGQHGAAEGVAHHAVQVRRTVLDDIVRELVQTIEIVGVLGVGVCVPAGAVPPKIEGCDGVVTAREHPVNKGFPGVGIAAEPVHQPDVPRARTGRIGAEFHGASVPPMPGQTGQRERIHAQNTHKTGTNQYRQTSTSTRWATHSDPRRGNQKDHSLGGCSGVYGLTRATLGRG